MSDELKPCPFCGEVPPPVKRVLNFPRDEWQWTIQCCCDMQPASWDEDKEKCISTWNTRAQLSAQVKETADSLHDYAVKLNEAAEKPADAKREIEVLRKRLAETTSVAITMLFDTHREDVLREFSVEELNDVAAKSAHLMEANVQVERVYKNAWDFAAQSIKGAKR